MSSVTPELLLKLTAEILLSGNGPSNETTMIGQIHEIYNALATCGDSTDEPAVEPAVPVKKSVTPNAITCLMCGAQHTMLKRHLVTAHGITADEYRARFNLPADYPLVAPNYSKKRSDLAKENGLGKSRFPAMDVT